MTAAHVKQVLEDEIAQRLMASPALARLAYTGADGGPRVVPVGYVWNGETFVVCTATNAPKVTALRRDPRVAFTVDTETQPPNILLVRGAASTEIVDGVPDEFLAASFKYIPESQRTDFEMQSRTIYPTMARITITPTWAKIIDFETRLPVAVQHLVDGTGPR